MTPRQLGPFSVSPIGLGCMNICHAYGTPLAPEQAERLLLAALDAGVTHFDTAALYGFGASETLVGRALSPHRGRFTLASKCGMTVEQGDGTIRPPRIIDGRPESLRTTCEGSLRRLKTDVIDLYYLHRWDKAVPVEDSVGALADLKRAGKIRAIGLSEVSAATLRRAHAVHPITALQTEYSLWTRNPEIAVLQACRELGVSFVAFSPVARGFLAGALPDQAAVDALPEKDLRRAMPRFAPEHFARNLRLLEGFRAIAAEADCTPAQLALAWLLHQGDHVLPIPGTRSIAHLREDLGAAEVRLPTDVLARLGALINTGTVSGHRYAEQARAEVDTETF
ncbi:MAG: Oxidoreductase, aldo/keto reductase family [Burkholderiaceae bacterium]|jgi:aryl-alcohol dehydrogenase-like predicted oxidoreductase|nr:MAG: Oxidoreductase, aldo/keto reductase family [Burkholderiaceae bacterium]